MADAALLHQRYTDLQAAEQRVEQLYARWAELEAEQTAADEPAAQ